MLTKFNCRKALPLNPLPAWKLVDPAASPQRAATCSGFPAVAGQVWDKFNTASPYSPANSPDPDSATRLVMAAGAAIVGVKLKGNGVLRVAIYTRYSTRRQRSTADQIRSCQLWAAANGMTVDVKMIFSDEGISGRVEDRPGLNKLRAAVVRGDIDVVLFFSTNRLYRKSYKALQFVEEVLINRGVRTVFVSQGIDSDNEETFDIHFKIAALVDDLITKQGHKHIKAAQITKALLNEVIGSRSFGYTRAVKEGLTKLGGPNQSNTICPVESVWVQRIFSWFVHEKLTYGEICRRFNCDPDAPKLVMAKRLDPRVLKNILANRRYIGDWSYGWTTNDWKGQQNGPMQKKLATPQHQILTPHLRIIDDVTFAAAQARLANMPGAGGRCPKNFDPGRPKHPLAGMLYCPTHGRIWQNNGQFWCIRCYKDHEETKAERTLFSGVQKDIALKAVCRAVGHALQQHAPTVAAVAAASIAAAKAALASDRRPLDKLSSQIAKLTAAINQLLNNLGETKQDQAESNARLSTLRTQRKQAEAEHASVEKSVMDPLRLPSSDEIRVIVADLRAVLAQAAQSDDYAVSLALRVALQNLIDGPIMLKQEGRAAHHRGWLQATITLRLDRIDPNRVIVGLKPVVLTVDLLSPNSPFYAGDEIIRLAAEKMPLKKIAKTVNVAYPIVCRFIAEHFDKADKGAYALARPFLPRSVLNGQSKYAFLKNEFKKLVDEGWLYQEIADKYGIDIHMIRVGLKAWYEERGLPIPDGRNRRKTLERKNRPKPPQEPPAAA